MSVDEITAARIAAIEREGYVVLRRKSYEHTRRELDRARNWSRYQEESNESTRRWAVNALDEQRRLAARLTFVYGVARSLGASSEDLRGDDADDRGEVPVDGCRCLYNKPSHGRWRRAETHPECPLHDGAP